MTLSLVMVWPNTEDTLVGAWNSVPRIKTTQRYMEVWLGSRELRRSRL